MVALSRDEFERLGAKHTSHRRLLLFSPTHFASANLSRWPSHSGLILLTPDDPGAA
jgi:hypothetical protein